MALNPRRLLIAFFIALAGIFLVGYSVASHRIARRLQKKVAAAQAGVRSWASHGQDPSTVLALMQLVRPTLEAGDPHKAEALLDRALKMLAAGAQNTAPSGSNPLPVSTQLEKESDLYVRPEPVAISGYLGSAMEPFISPDGQTLFFNNENDPNVNTNLHFAQRTGKLSFRYLGELPGTNSPVLDAAPSIDWSGHLYFTTVRDYGRAQNSVYMGDFRAGAVWRVRPVPGHISPTAPGQINMDVNISPDGQTLYISRALIFPGAAAPLKSELMVAGLKNGSFSIAADSQHLMKNINTGALQYAPAISADGRELYFTRASQLMAGSGSAGARLRIMVAARPSVSQPFGEPRTLKELAGFVEAPSVSADGQEMFFHKKTAGKFAIFRAQRNRSIRE